MSGNRRAPLGFLGAGLLIILATIGVVNGLWSKNLVINGTVTTGDLNVDWVVASSGDEFGPDDCTGSIGTLPPWNPLFPCPSPDKDVGSMFCEVDEGDAQIINFEVFNGYPSYEADCEVEFLNTGSIPVNVIGFAIIPGDDLTNCGLIINLTQSKVLQCDQLKIGFFDNVGLQVDPGDQPGSSIRIHVEQAAEQNNCSGTTFLNPGGGPVGPFPQVTSNCPEELNPELVSYEFAVKLCVAQWNEEASFEDCVDSAQHEGPPNGPGDNDGIPYWQDSEGPSPNDDGLNGGDDCFDGIDNDGDGDIDAADDGCVI
jgi:hypothetical protein